MKVYVVTYYDYERDEVEEVYLSKDKAYEYAEVRNKKISKIDDMNRICRKCENNKMMYRDCCVHKIIKKDRHGLYCEASFSDTSGYGACWQVVEKVVIE